MANELYRVWQNFVWRIESVTPSCTASAEKFQEMDRQISDPSESPAFTRAFEVSWMEAGAGVELEDGFLRRARHMFAVEVHYVDLRWTALQELVTKDRHDLLEQLRDAAKWVGYSSANPSTDIGLMDRRYTRSRLTDNRTHWTMQIDFDCLVFEQEA